MGIPPGLRLAKVAFQVACQGVFPLGLGAVIVRRCEPERAKLQELVLAELDAGDAELHQGSREGLLAWLPVGSHGEPSARIENVLARWWWCFFCICICICIWGRYRNVTLLFLLCSMRCNPCLA